MRKQMSVVLPALLMLAGCTTDAAGRAYEVADFRARWLDRYQVDKWACERAGGVIVRERHEPDPLRIGDSGPEVGSRYYCLRAGAVIR